MYPESSGKKQKWHRFLRSPGRLGEVGFLGGRTSQSHCMPHLVLSGIEGLSGTQFPWTPSRREAGLPGGQQLATRMAGVL